MGNISTSNQRIIYEKLTEEDKNKIAEQFRVYCSDYSVSEISYERELSRVYENNRANYEFQYAIKSDKRTLVFYTKADFLDFVRQSGRPFVLTKYHAYETNYYYISFVYAP